MPRKIFAILSLDVDKEHRFQLIDALDNLKNDLDEDVAEAAFDCEN